MPKFKLNLSEPSRLFPAYGELSDGAVIEAAEQPHDGVTWSWSKAGNATPDVAEPVVPDSAAGVLNPSPEPAAEEQPES